MSSRRFVVGSFRLVAQDADGNDFDVLCDANGKLRVISESTVEFDPEATDPLTGALKQITYEHHEIHDGKSFTLGHSADIGNGANCDVMIVTPNSDTLAHLTYEYEAELENDFSVFEGISVSGNGTPLTIFNRDRNSAGVSVCTAFHSPTVTGTGTKIRPWHMGSGRSFGGGDRATHEWIMKKNTKYLFRITNSTANNNYMSIKLDWYEQE